MLWLSCLDSQRQAFWPNLRTTCIPTQTVVLQADHLTPPSTSLIPSVPAGGLSDPPGATACLSDLGMHVKDRVKIEVLIHDVWGA